MKNVLIWVHPNKSFIGETSVTVKLQIDNSLDLGWKKEDIILATNFDFEYNGVKSIVVSDDNYLPDSKPESKLQAILELFKIGFIRKRDLYWFHDLDAYQSEILTESELEMGEADMALTKYGWRDRWSTGSIFFTSKALDIFKKLVQTHTLLRSTDEMALTILTNGLTKEEENNWKNKINSNVINKIPKIKNINRRIKQLNISYNFFSLINPRRCYELAIKPIKVPHFHPYGQYTNLNIPSFLNFYMYGVNEINQIFMSKRLIKIFKKHGVK